MSKQTIETANAPAPIGPYSQAIRAGSTLFLSGQVAIDPATGDVVDGGVADQTDRVFKNLVGVLTAAGATLQDVVKTTVFLRDMNDFAEMNEVYGRYLDNNPPARSCVEVSRLPKDVAVEIDLIAWRPTD